MLHDFELHLSGLNRPKYLPLVIHCLIHSATQKKYKQQKTRGKATVKVYKKSV